jgi:hypothetical protein
VTQGGGFVPVVTTSIADTARLAAEDADQLRAKVERAALKARDPEPNQPAYLITIEDGGQHRRISLGESDLTEAQRDLIEFIGSVEGHEEQVGPLGH